MTWWLAIALALAGPTGFRQGGSAREDAATPPPTWGPTENVCWSAPLASWSNASPVRMGSLVCVQEEPVTVACHDVSTGVRRWAARADKVEALPKAEQAAARAVVQAAEAAASELVPAREAYSKTLRAVRAGTATSADLEALSRRVDALKATVEAASRWRTPPDRGIVGYSSATPVTDGRGLFTLFAHGVVAAWEPDGTRRWIAVQPEPPRPMLGYDDGQSASPVLAGGLLIVPYGKLTARRTDTGAVVWQGASWPHYAGPAVLRAGGQDLLVTPDGQLVRAADGKVLRKDMALMWYLTPAVHGDRIYFLEARSDGLAAQNGGTDLVAWQVHDAEGGASELWRVRLPVTRAFYTAPVASADAVFMVDWEGEALRVDAATGAVQKRLRLEPLRPHPVYTSPILAGGALYTASEQGATVRLALDTLAPTLVGTLGPSRATPAFDGARVYVRTLDRLYCLCRR
jgi:outer membrane protein assembly factor BamB